MPKLNNEDLERMKIILRKLMNKHRYGGVHVEKTQLYRWGLTKNGLKYFINQAFSGLEHDIILCPYSSFLCA